MLRELNLVIDYIEDHLTENMSTESIAAYAHVSNYHLKQVFFYLTGISLTEYIKNRKLSEANKDLLSGDRVMEIAYKYGYQSVDGFTRAFKKWSGHLPSSISQKQIKKVFPKYSFKISVTGGTYMEYRIETKPAFNLFGVSKRVPLQFEGINKDIVALAESISPQQRDEMRAIKNMDPKEILNISYQSDTDFLKEEGWLTHMIGVASSKHDSSLLEKIEVEAGSWVVFLSEGQFPEHMQQTMAKAYAEWLPSSNYEIINAPTFSFTKMDKYKKEHAYSEIWIPIKPKG